MYLKGHKLLLWLKWRLPFLSSVIEKSQSYFNRLGGLAIFLSRFLAPALGGTVNILAGAEVYRYWRFLIYDAIGEVIGAAIPLALGYTFAASWEALGDVLASISTFSIGLCAVVVLLIYLVRTLRSHRQVPAIENVALGEHESQEIALKSSDILPP